MPRAQPSTARGHGGSALHAHFTTIDWTVLVGYLALTTLLGAFLAGRQTTIREFFLAGRKLPWWAVSGSIIATEISAVTFLSVPAIVYKPGGDFTYLQLGLGAILARIIVGVWFTRVFYQREIYSPYDYMGHWLGPDARRATTALFMLGSVLGQSVRVLLTAVVLEQISGLSLFHSIWIISAIAIVWTLLGGMTTVIWTDVIQFFVFLLGLAAALVYVVLHVPGGWADVTAVAAAADKFRLWDLSLDPQKAFTLWAALLGNTLLCLNAYGTDQLIAQRMFCCRTQREARLAIIVASVGQLIALVALFVGIALYAFYHHFPLAPDVARRVAAKPDTIFPIFIVSQLPPGLTGLVIAGVFAAAISSLDSALAALSQSLVTTFYQPWHQRRRLQQSPERQRRDTTDTTPPLSPSSDQSPERQRRDTTDTTPPACDSVTSAPDPTPPDDRHYVRVSRLLVIFWGIALGGVALLAELARQRYEDILNLALAMATYTGGALLAAFLLAFFRLNVDARGLLWAAPLSVLTVFAITWHQRWAQLTTILLAAVILVAWLATVLRAYPAASPRQRRNDILGTFCVALTGALAVFLCSYKYPAAGDHHYLGVAWPWNVPIGFVVALTLSYVLARPRGESANPSPSPATTT